MIRHKPDIHRDVICKKQISNTTVDMTRQNTRHTIHMQENIDIDDTNNCTYGVCCRGESDLMGEAQELLKKKRKDNRKKDRDEARRLLKKGKRKKARDETRELLKKKTEKKRDRLETADPSGTRSNLGSSNFGSSDVRNEQSRHPRECPTYNHDNVLGQRVLQLLQISYALIMESGSQFWILVPAWFDGFFRFSWSHGMCFWPGGPHSDYLAICSLSFPQFFQRFGLLCFEGFGLGKFIFHWKYS